MAAFDLNTTFAGVLLFFGIAGVVVPILQRFKLSSVSAYLICGMIFGPWGLATWLKHIPHSHYFTLNDPHLLHILGELGIITMMFMIGLELSIDRLKELRRFIFGLGSAQILITGFVIAVIALAYEHSKPIAAILGLAFAFSSTAIVMKLLEDKHLMNQTIGTVCFSILLMQDLAVVPVIILTNTLTGNSEQTGAEAILHAIITFTLLVPTIYVLGRKLLRPLLSYVSISSNAEWLSAFIIFIVILCAVATHAAGLSIALGGFLAGILVAETEFKHEVEVSLAPIKGMLLGIFFLYIGTQINLQEVMYQPLTLGVSVLALFFVKAAILLLIGLAFKLSIKKALFTSCYLSQPGEFALLVLGLVATTNLLAPHDLQFFLLVVTLGMLGSPLMFNAAPLLWKWLSSRVQNTPKDDTTMSHEQEMVVIAGFGRVGKLLCETLEQQRVPYIAFDNNAPKVKAARKKGYNVVYGDAQKFNFWRKLHEGKINAAVIAIDDCEAIKHIIRSIRQEWPLLPIIVRAQDVQVIGLLYDYGATHVITEPLESSLSIARVLFKETGMHAEQAESTVAQLRDKHVYQF